MNVPSVTQLSDEGLRAPWSNLIHNGPDARDVRSRKSERLAMFARSVQLVRITHVRSTKESRSDQGAEYDIHLLPPQSLYCSLTLSGLGLCKTLSMQPAQRRITEALTKFHARFDMMEAQIARIHQTRSGLIRPLDRVRREDTRLSAQSVAKRSLPAKVIHQARITI